MRKQRLATLAAAVAVAGSALAGGLLTNTNQNIAFLRNPARDAAIGIDGVYSNPAGVAFLGDGFHLSLNFQNAHQTRTILTGYPLFVNNAANTSGSVHKFEGNADAPVVPSLQAAYNRGRWSLQFGFAITGGGGKCEFDGGLGSFEQVVAGVTSYASAITDMYAQLSQIPGMEGMAGHAMGSRYAYDSYMRGRQYYYGFTLGAAYKVTDRLSVYGGLRLLYGTSNYYGYVKDIRVEHLDGATSEMVNASRHFAHRRAPRSTSTWAASRPWPKETTSSLRPWPSRHCPACARLPPPRPCWPRPRRTSNLTATRRAGAWLPSSAWTTSGAR